MPTFRLLHKKSVVMSRHGKTGGSGRVGSGQLGLRVKRVAGQNESFLNKSIGLRVTSLVRSSWPVFFKQFFFFFEIDAICQLLIFSLTVIRFSLVILLPITTKHLTWYPNLMQLLFQLSRSQSWYNLRSI